MERTAALSLFDSSFCSYVRKYDQSKQDEVDCYRPDKKQIGEFYTSMADQFYQHRIKAQEETRRPNRDHKIKEKIAHQINNPISSALPNQIAQGREIKVGKTVVSNGRMEPMFSQVQCTKKNNYVIGEEVRSMVTQDIQQMIKSKEEFNFRRHFPLKPIKNTKEAVINSIQTQQLIKTYNRILLKYKNDSTTVDPNLKLLNFNAFQEGHEDVTLDHQLFNLLGLFKKIYFQTKSEYINEHLIKYVMKFQKQDQFQRKIRTKKINSCKKSRSNIKSASSKSVWNSKQSKLELPGKGKQENRISINVDSSIKKSKGSRKEVKFRSSVGGQGRCSAMDGCKMKLRL